MATIPEALAIAVQHHQAGRLHAAEQIYRQILAAEPNHADACHLLGVLAGQAGKHEDAIEYIGRAIGLKGNTALFYNNLGEAYRALRKIPEAVACCRRALALQPDFSEAHYNLGNALKDQGKMEEAVGCYRRALELNPDYAAAHDNLGNAFLGQGKLDEAVACYRRALGLQPNYAAAHNNLGNALKDLGKLPEAVACYRRAVELQPELAVAHNNLGNALKDLGKPDEAVACYRRALELKPDYVEPHNNLGIAFQDQGKLDEAVACCRRALELQPDFAEAHWNRSLLWLLCGNFAAGWPEYEWRWRRKDCPQRRFTQPLWDGHLLRGKTILLHAEQGLGDTIQFVRYATLVRQHAARVVVECQPPLLRLLAGCPGIDQLLGAGEELPAFDVHAPLMSLPRICKTTLENIPAGVPYVFPAPALVAQWRERLRAIDGFTIGIGWQGNPKYPGDRSRSIPLRHFADLVKIPGVCLVSLQKGAGREQLAAIRGACRIVDLAAELDEQAGAFMDTAAVMKNLDLVITSDTALAHLAGAIGVPVWVALPLVPDWRWLLDRGDSPWYPTMRLFRQRRWGDWQGVFQRIQTALREQMAGLAPSPSGRGLG